MSAPIRVLELRTVRGTGGGPEKTILAGTARTDASAFAITVCYIRDARDEIFSIDRKAAPLGLDYVEVVERHSFDPSIWPRLRHLVRERGIDIVHAHDYKTDLLAWLLARREGVVPLATVHGWTGHSRRERWLYYPADRRILARFPRLIAVSGDVRRELIQAGAPPDRVVTVLNGIDPQAFRRDRSREAAARRGLGLNERDVVIGAVGRLEPQKRFDLLIDAVADLRAAWPSLRLVIAGDGSLRDALVAQARARGLADACLFTGHRTDIADLHHAFDLFVQSSDYEGTPNAVLEAMAMETPLVATAAGGTAEIARHGLEGLIVPVSRPEALVEAIRKALGDRGAALARAAAARRRVETDLSFDARMRKVEQVYIDLVEDRRRAGAAAALPART
jgi:glycosyltransferase involved in cell wall biosynthesis